MPIANEIQTDIVAVQQVYYKQYYNFSYQWMLVMSTQMIGFSIGGIARRFLVTPPSMSKYYCCADIGNNSIVPPSKVWPANLVLCALFNTLHSQEYIGMGKRGGLSRERFFVYSLVIATVYCACSAFASSLHKPRLIRTMLSSLPHTLRTKKNYGTSHPICLVFCFEDFFPGYLFTALSTFTWVCWIAPRNGMSNIINPPILSYSENVYSHDHAYVSRPYASINSGEFDFNIIYHSRRIRGGVLLVPDSCLLCYRR